MTCQPLLCCPLSALKRFLILDLKKLNLGFERQHASKEGGHLGSQSKYLKQQETCLAHLSIPCATFQSCVPGFLDFGVCKQKSICSHGTPSKHLTKNIKPQFKKIHQHRPQIEIDKLNCCIALPQCFFMMSRWQRQSEPYALHN